MLTPLIRTRVIQSLEGTPTVLRMLVSALTADDLRWDYCFDPDRFTLREILAHIVDYDNVWNDYVDHALYADVPVAVPPYTPDSVAAKRDYRATDPQQSLDEFKTGRPILVAKLKALEAAAWAHHSVLLPSGAHLNVDELSTLFVAHDGYHARQIAEYASFDFSSRNPDVAR